MKIKVDEEGTIVFGEVFNPICFETQNQKESVGIVLRDNGFEISYVHEETVTIVEMKDGKVTPWSKRYLTKDEIG